MIMDSHLLSFVSNAERKKGLGKSYNPAHHDTNFVVRKYLLITVLGPKDTATVITEGDNNCIKE